MKKAYIILLSLLTASLILVGCGEEPKEEKVFGDGETGEVVNHIQVNCENSGGIFTDGSCTCAEGFTYNEKSGFCTNAEGAPGGSLGEEVSA